VAFRAALEAKTAAIRRRKREVQVKNTLELAVAPAEQLDWRPLLDQELETLPEKYRDVVVLCDLEGKSRKEAAKLLGIPEGTICSRMAKARRMLAKKLSRHGLSISGGALATALAAEARAAVPASLTISTVRAGLLVAAGQVTAVAGTAPVLMQGVIKAMLFQKLKMVVACVLVAAVLGASGLAYRAAEPTRPAADKPLSEVESLRKEVELLRLNLLVVLEKVRAQEAELVLLRGKGEKEAALAEEIRRRTLVERVRARELEALKEKEDAAAANRIRALREIRLRESKVRDAEKAKDAVREVEEAVAALKKASDPEAKKRALMALEKATQKLRGDERTSPGRGAGSSGKGGGQEQ
jgi:hypothetical protein